MVRTTREEANRDVAMDHQVAVQAAADFAQQATSVADKLEPGTYDAVQALALVSIAHSLSVLAELYRHA
jgi:hypothetical protein